jgi:hypothetical protein
MLVVVSVLVPLDHLWQVVCMGMVLAKAIFLSAASVGSMHFTVVVWSVLWLDLVSWLSSSSCYPLSHSINAIGPAPLRSGRIMVIMVMTGGGNGLVPGTA